MGICHQKLSLPPSRDKPEQTHDRAHRSLHQEMDLVVIKWIQTGQHIDEPQVPLTVVLTRPVPLVQDLLPWNSEVVLVEDKQNKQNLSKIPRRAGGEVILFFFFDSCSILL